MAPMTSPWSPNWILMLYSTGIVSPEIFLISVIVFICSEPRLRHLLSSDMSFFICGGVGLLMLIPMMSSGWMPVISSAVLLKVVISPILFMLIIPVGRLLYVSSTYAMISCIDTASADLSRTCCIVSFSLLSIRLNESAMSASSVPSDTCMPRLMSPSAMRSASSASFLIGACIS